MPKSISDNAEKYLAPNASVSISADLASIGGSAAQQAFGAEYNIYTLVKYSAANSGNSAGVTNSVGTSTTPASTSTSLAGGAITASGSASPTQQTSTGAASPDGSLSQGMTGYDTGTGWWLGVDHGVPKFSLGTAGGSSYITWDGTTLSVVGGVSVSSLNIPDTTTASSFHVDSSGNTWWGANVSSGYTAANAYVLATGQAIFKNAAIGGTTIQYQVNNNGIFSFGDGSDGAGVADGSTALAGATLSVGNYTLTRDAYYTNLTISTGVTIFPAGYRIFGTCTLTMNGTGTIDRSGYNASTNTGGAALADGYLKGALAGANGGGGGAGGGGSSAGNGTESDGTGTSNSLGSNGSGGGAGGGTASNFQGGGGGAGAGGTATASNVKLIANWHLATLLDISSTGSTVKFNNSGSGGGGGGGGGGGTSQSASGDGGTNGSGGNGGGAGSGGGIVAIYFRNIVIGASAVISANGGNGANGSNGANGIAGTTWNRSGGSGGGGGAGGNGGIIVLVYNMLTNSGTISVSGGTKGTHGNGGTATTTKASNSEQNGINGNDGNNGSAGVINEFQLSL